MLKKICFTLSLLSFFQSVEIKAQNEQLSITYDYYFERNLGDFKINLLADQKESHQTIIRNFRMQNPSGEIENMTTKRYIYEDLDQQEIFFWEEFVDIYVKESLNTMTWELTENTKKILNYTCNEAKSNWRGRDYIAYFTTELPFKAAPWKFHGLPGVMLEIQSSDSNVIFKAIKVKIGQNLGGIANPFKDKKLKTWTDFIELYKIQELKMIEISKKMEARTGKKHPRSSNRIELPTKETIQAEKEYDAFMIEWKKKN